MRYNKFYVVYEDGFSITVEFPDDWTVEEVAAQHNVHPDSVQGPYPVE